MSSSELGVSNQKWKESKKLNRSLTKSRQDKYEKEQEKIQLEEENQKKMEEEKMMEKIRALREKMKEKRMHTSKESK